MNKVRCRFELRKMFEGGPQPERIAELLKSRGSALLMRWTVEQQMFQRRPAHIKAVPTEHEVTEARFRRFLKELDTYERKVIFERTLDAFLDLYSSWKKTHQAPLKVRLVMLAFELHRLDHEFECDLSFKD